MAKPLRFFRSILSFSAFFTFAFQFTIGLTILIGRVQVAGPVRIFHFILGFGLSLTYFVFFVLETFEECGSREDLIFCRSINLPFWTNYAVMSLVLAVSSWFIALVWVDGEDLVSLKDCSKWQKFGSVPPNRAAQQLLD